MESILIGQLTLLIVFIVNINWIEKDGLTASQVLDFNTNTAVVFLTWEDDSEYGNRGSILQRGTFEIK